MPRLCYKTSIPSKMRLSNAYIIYKIISVYTVFGNVLSLYFKTIYVFMPNTRSALVTHSVNMCSTRHAYRTIHVHTVEYASITEHTTSIWFIEPDIRQIYAIILSSCLHITLRSMLYSSVTVGFKWWGSFRLLQRAHYV